MKILKYIAISLLASGCKTKTVTVEKTADKEKEVAAQHYDSIVTQSVDLHLNNQKQYAVFNDKLKLSSIAELDSLGNRKPFHYKYYVDGKLKEEIFLEGGEINRQKDSEQSEELLKKDKVKSENLKTGVDSETKKEVEKTVTKKIKKAAVKGFQFGFYLWLLLIIVVIIILNWLSKRLNWKDFFGKKEG